MDDSKRRPVLPGPQAEDVFDPTTRLLWQRVPTRDATSWHEAADAAARAGGRLPSAAELVAFLSCPPDEALRRPAPGELFWSASESPFAPRTLVRAVELREVGRPMLLLLDKSARALGWCVRERR